MTPFDQTKPFYLTVRIMQPDGFYLSYVLAKNGALYPYWNQVPVRQRLQFKTRGQAASYQTLLTVNINESSGEF